MKLFFPVILAIGLCSCHETREYKDLNSYQKREVDELVTQQLQQNKWELSPQKATQACSQRSQNSVQVFKQQSRRQQLCANQVKLENTQQQGVYRANYYEQNQLVYQTNVELKSVTVDTDAQQVEQVQFQISDAKKQDLNIEKIRVVKPASQNQAQVYLQGQNQSSRAQVSQQSVDSLFGSLGNYIELNISDFIDL